MGAERLSRHRAVAAAAAMAFAASLGAAEAAAADHEALVRLVRRDCGACHGMNLTGGLGLPLTPEALRGKPVDYLVATILDGHPGTAMPPWRPYLSSGDAQWIAERLLQGFPQEGP